MYPVNYLDFEPRFGFAWSPRLFGWNERGDFVVRGGYGISHAPLTGNNRLPNPDFGATNTVSTTATGSSGTVDPTQPLRLSTNPPLVRPISPEAALNIPADGLVYLNSINIPGFVVSENTKTPYVQNWNLTLSYEVMKNTVLEIAYVGSKGTHLFMPLVNINPRDFAYVEAVEGANLPNQNSDTNVPDPLGRRNLLGSPISVPLGTLASQYLGFDRLNIFYDTSANSIRHGMHISLNRRFARGLSVTANYTYGKSIDDASDASPDKNVLTSGSTTGGHVTFGAPRSADRSISAFDIKHSFSSTFLYDLPFGHGRHFLTQAWRPVQWVAGDWTLSGVVRLQSGYPFLPSIVDTNRLSGSITHTIRPDIVPGVPLVNPLWRRDCPTSDLCEPYVNPAAFMRPAKGTLGNAPRTLDIRGPMQEYFDVSFQKNFPIDEKRRVQIRVDLINAFNHPNFRISSGNAGPDLIGLPDEAVISAADYNAWAAFNGKPLSTTPAGAALLAQVQQIVISSRLPSGALPADFFHIPLPQGFATTNFNSFDITTPTGYKLYRLRRAYNQGFGQLNTAFSTPRYIQFGVKVYF